MNDFVKGFLLTAVPALVLSAVSAVGATISEFEGSAWFIFMLVWPLALVAFIVTLILGLTGAAFKSKKGGRAGVLAGIGVAVISLGVSCFALFNA